MVPERGPAAALLGGILKEPDLRKSYAKKLCSSSHWLQEAGSVKSRHFKRETLSSDIMPTVHFLLWPDPAFLAKDEDPSVWRSSINVKCLNHPNRDPHPLCPVNALREYLLRTQGNRDGPLFLNPRSLKQCSTIKIQYIFRDLIVRANPQARARFHEIRKFASSLGFFNGMSTLELCDRIGWSSVRVFKKHYRQQLRALVFTCIFLGSRAIPSVAE